MVAADVARFLEDGDDAGRGFCGVRLLTGHRVLGALALRRRRALSAEERLLYFAVADMLASPLRSAEYARRLESEVVERTMQTEEQRRFTAKIIDSLPVGLYVIDRDYRIQAWNRKRETGMQGVSRAEAIGRTIFEILHRQPAEVLRREFEDVFASGGMQQFQIESSASGERRTYRITKIPMRLDDSAVTHVITIGEDVTEWRDAQDRFAQAEKLAAIGTLAAGVMHEINNPLATIGACAEGLALQLVEWDAAPAAAPALRDALAEALRLIQHEVHRCKGIVEGVLGFSRPKQAAKALVDVNVVLEKTLFLLKHHSRFKKLSVELQTTSPLPPVVASEEQLVQVFMALMLNAVDAMQERGTIVLRTRTDDLHAAVVAEIVDHGEGIRRSELSKIFEPFYTTKPPGRGTGLGLSICYAIITEHGGRIEVDSVAGQGSAFRIVLPRAIPEALRPAV
ncbi:MAG TPA: ATP-binding protein [Gemmatimonadaceae bacterium]|nr:ATP-binding protein [Gemmatimonadaceae bacterium]